MISLTENDYIKRAKANFDKVFTGDDAYGEPFHKEIKERQLLFPYRYQLKWEEYGPWVDPIIKTLRDFGEKGFFVSAINRPKVADQKSPYHFYVPIDEILLYGRKIYDQENAVYSENGLWGIICSDEDHALIGGPRRLIDNLLSFVPNINDRLDDFINYWKYYEEKNQVDISWLPKVLGHIYGREKMVDILLKEGLKKLLG